MQTTEHTLPELIEIRGFPRLKDPSEASKRIGLRVAYEDMANPLRAGTVEAVHITRFGIEYDVQWDDNRDGLPREHRTDLVQRGWRPAAPAA